MSGHPGGEMLAFISGVVAVGGSALEVNASSSIHLQGTELRKKTVPRRVKKELQADNNRTPRHGGKGRVC
jgi:hypothetical protein